MMLSSSTFVVSALPLACEPDASSTSTCSWKPSIFSETVWVFAARLRRRSPSLVPRVYRRPSDRERPRAAAPSAPREAEPAQTAASPRTPTRVRRASVSLGKCIGFEVRVDFEAFDLQLFLRDPFCASRDQMGQLD